MVIYAHDTRTRPLLSARPTVFVNLFLTHDSHFSFIPPRIRLPNKHSGNHTTSFELLPETETRPRACETQNFRTDLFAIPVRSCVARRVVGNFLFIRITFQLVSLSTGSHARVEVAAST